MCDLLFVHTEDGVVFTEFWKRYWAWRNLCADFRHIDPDRLLMYLSAWTVAAEDSAWAIMRQAMTACDAVTVDERYRAINCAFVLNELRQFFRNERDFVSADLIKQMLLKVGINKTLDTKLIPAAAGKEIP